MSAEQPGAARIRAMQAAAERAVREHPDDDWAAFQALRMEIDQGNEPTPREDTP